MGAEIRIYLFSSPPHKTLWPVNYPAEPVRPYLPRHREFSRETFLADAVHKEMSSREQNEKRNRPWHDRLDDQPVSPWFAYRPPLRDEDIRVHAWLNERLTAVDRKRHGLWPKIRRFFFGNRRDW
jgi:hypothetical protein